MRRVLFAVLLAVTLASCAPAVLDPNLPPAADVTFEALPVGAGTLYRVEAQEPIDRLALLFTGDGLQVNAPECQVTPTDVACIVRDVFLFYEITVSGEVALAEAIVERDGEYGILTLGP